MEPGDNPEDSRGHSSAINPLTTRGRKRDRSALTTPVGSSVFRERSKSLIVHFKKPRCSPPVGSSVFRERSKSLGPNFEKPRLPKRRLRPKNVPSRGNAPPAANVTTPTPSFTPPTPSFTPPTPSFTSPTHSFTPPTPSFTPHTPSFTPPTASLAPPTPSFTPPTPSLAPPTASLVPPTPSSAPPTLSLALPTSSLAPPTSSSAPPTSSLAPPIPSSAPPTPSLAPPSVTVVRSKAEANEEDDRRINSRMFDCLEELLLLSVSDLLPSDYEVELLRSDYEVELLRRIRAMSTPLREPVIRPRFLVDREAKQRIVQLLRREDKRSREQDSGQHLQKKQDHINLFRDIEESGKNWWRSQKSPSLPEELDEAVERFLYRGDEDGLRGETQRLYRYQKLLEQWNEAFTQEKHYVCDWVGDCLKDMLAEVHRHIARFTRVERLLVPLSGFLVDREAKQRIVQLLRREDKRSREQDSGQHLQKKQDHINLFRDIEESGKNWSEERSWRSQKSPSLPEELHEAVERFLYRGHKDRLRRETRRLRRYQKLLKQWSKAFTQEEHDVCDWVGDCLKDVLAEVHRHIARFTRMERLLVPLSGFLVDREAKQRIVQLLRREDERSKEQDSGQHLQKKQDHINLFRDIEELGKNWREQEMFWRSPHEKQKSELHFLRDEERLRAKIQPLLGHWWLLGPQCLSSKSCSNMSRSADWKMEEPMEASPPSDTPTALSTMGRFYQSSSGKTRRSLSVRNRKYLRRLHTRTAGGALRRGRLTDGGLKLCSQVTHGSGLSLKPADCPTLN